MELQESTRLRDRSIKKDRDRSNHRSKRRRGDKDCGDDSSEEESVKDEDGDDDEGGSMRYLSEDRVSVSSSMASALMSYRSSYGQAAKGFRGGPVTTWRPGDEMIGVLVPRKARSASTKRSHDYWSSTGGLAGDPIFRQASGSPLRPSMAAAVVANTQLSSSPPPPPPPISPSSSNISLKKKLPNGVSKQRPPKSSSKSSASIQDEIEIEVAEVLFGLMRQTERPSLAKGHAMASDSAPFEANSISTVPPLVVVAPKRKRPRLVSYGDENMAAPATQSIPISSSIPEDSDHLAAKPEVLSPNLEKVPGSTVENVGVTSDSMKSQETPAEAVKLKPGIEELEMRDRDVAMDKGSETPSGKKESPDDCGESIATKANLANGDDEKQGEKFEIDLMAPLLLASRPLPEREGVVVMEEVGGGERDQRCVVTDVLVEEVKPARPVEDEKAVNPAIGGVNVAAGVDDVNATAKSTKLEAEPLPLLSKQPLNLSNINNERNIDLQLDLHKAERPSSANDTKLKEQFPKQQQQQPKICRDDASSDNKAAGQSSTVPVALSVPSGWHGGLQPVGYVPPLQGILPMDGSAMASTAIQAPFVFTRPRPKRCATHCFIAQNISVHQHYSKMPFWPAAAAAGTPPLFGAKTPYSLNMMPSAAGLHIGRGASAGPDLRGPAAFAFFPGQPPPVGSGGKENAAHPGGVTGDSTQKKQFLLQQSFPPGAPNNIMHGPAFIFPLSQQAAASIQPPPSTPSPIAPNISSSTSGCNSATPGVSSAPPPSPIMSFGYPNMAGNEARYLTILGNNPYTFPIPGAIGATAPYRGTNPQVMPFLNGSFYSSQMLQHPGHSLQIPQTHQNPGTSTPHKHHQRPQGTVASGSAAMNSNLQNVPAAKTRPSQPEMGGEDSPSTADSSTRPPKSGVYNHNFVLPIHQSDKKQQQQGVNPGMESLSPAFAMPYASINGATTNALDISSFAKNHPILSTLPDTGKYNYPIMAVNAQAMLQQQQQKESNLALEDENPGANDHLKGDEERKSIALSMADSGDSSTPGNNVVDSSARSLNLVTGSARQTRSSTQTAATNASVSNSQQQQMQPPVFSYQKQQQFAAAAATARSKSAATSNGSVYPDYLSSSILNAKFPNTLTGFPPLVQNTSAPIQSPQWKTAVRPTTSQVSSALTPSSTVPMSKNLPQQQGRGQPNHTQISFSTINPNRAPSPPVTVGLPATSSMSKSASGSPRTMTSTSTVSPQPGKNSPLVCNQKPSILGTPPMASSSGSANKYQPMLSKHNLQQAQLFFSAPYMQGAANTPVSSQGVGAYYLQRHRQENQQHPASKSQVTVPPSSSNGVFSLCTLPSTGTSDPAKAIVAPSSTKGAVTSQGMLQGAPATHQVVSAGLAYAPVQVKQAAEQKQPVGE